MKTIELLNGGRMPVLGFGTWQLTGKDCVRAVREAIDIGYRHIDTAQIYENEAEVGEALDQACVPRSELFITTKVWTTNYRRKQVAASVEESLDKLGTDHVDLLLMHWPNPEVKLAETLEVMEQLIHEKKTRAIGVSNFPVAQMKEAVEVCKAPIACNQVEYHALLSQAAVLDYAHAHGMVVTAYSPLARAKLLSHPLLNEIGVKYGKTSAQVALRWLVEQPGVAAIPKAASGENARLNFDIFDFALTPQEHAAIDALRGNTRIINPSFAPVWDAA